MNRFVAVMFTLIAAQDFVLWAVGAPIPPSARLVLAGDTAFLAFLFWTAE